MKPGEGVIEMDDGRLATENAVPGTRVYDEDLIRLGNKEFRTWNPTKSKLAAYLLKGGGAELPLDRYSRVLYLGAANGTTPSHVSDIVRDGVVYGVEFSPRSFRDLMGIANVRPNLMPLLADAWQPDLYGRFVGTVDVLYQDIAQRQQGAIFAKNLNRFKPAHGLLCIKARSVDVAAQPRDVYERIVAEVQEISPYRLVELIDLGPFERDHAAALFVRDNAGGRRFR